MSYLAETGYRKHPTGRCADPEQIRRLAEGFGVATISERDVPAARNLAASLLGDQIAAEDAYSGVIRLAKSSLLGVWENGALVCALASIPVRERAISRIEAGTFDPFTLDFSLVAPDGEEPAASYGWGVASASKDATRKLVLAGLAIHSTLLWDIPAYAHAVTDAGRAILARIGYELTGPAARAMYRLAPPGRGA